MDAVVAFIANGEATEPVEPGECALDDPAEHAKAAAVTCGDSNERAEAPGCLPDFPAASSSAQG